MPKFSIETIFRLYNDTSGDYIEVAPIGDIPGLLSLSARDGFGVLKGEQIDLTLEEAGALADMLIRAGVELRKTLPIETPPNWAEDRQ